MWIFILFNFFPETQQTSAHQSAEETSNNHFVGESNNMQIAYQVVNILEKHDILIDINLVSFLQILKIYLQYCFDSK